MLFLSIFAISGLGIIFSLSLWRWDRGKSLLNNLDSSKYLIFKDKTVLSSAELKLGESLGIPINSTILINQQQIIIVASKFNPLLFMTGFPFNFRKEKNLKSRILRSDKREIIFTACQTYPNLFGTCFEITIKEYDLKEKEILLDEIKNWCIAH